MDTIITLLFDNPLYIFIILSFAFLICFGLWYQRRDRRSLIRMAIPAALAVVIAVGEILVVTDREQIQQALIELENDLVVDKIPKSAMEKRSINLQATEKYLDEDIRVDLGEFGGPNLNKKRILSKARGLISLHTISKMSFSGISIDIDDGGETAKTHFNMMVNFRSKEMGEQRTSLIWDVYWIKRDEGWRINKVDAPKSGIDF